MAYTDVWNGAIPNGTEPANTIDDIFRSLKLDISERLDDIFDMPTFVTDPLRPYGLKFTDVQDAHIRLGDAGAGNNRTLHVTNKANSIDYITIVDGGIVIGPGLGVGAAGKIANHTTDGLQLSGRAGSIYNFVLATPAGAYVLRNPISTQNIELLGSLSAVGSINSSSNVVASGDVIIAGGGFLDFLSKSLLRSNTDGNFTVSNNANTSFGLLQFGGITASFPAWKRSGVTLQARLADDSGDAALSANTGLFSGDITLNSATVAAIDFYNTNFRIQVTQATGVMDFKTNNVTGLSLANGGVGVTVPGTLAVTGNITTSGNVLAGAANFLEWTGKSTLSSPVDSNILLTNNAVTGFNLLQFGGTTASFPALKRNTTALEAKLADDSAYTQINVSSIAIQGGAIILNTTGQAKIIGGTTGILIRNNADNVNLISTDNTGNFTNAGFITSGSTITSGSSIAAAAGSVFVWTGRSQLTSPVDGNIVLRNNAGTGFSLLQLGGTAGTNVALKANSNQLQIRLGDDSGFANINAFSLEATASGQFFFTGRSGIQSTADGNIVLLNNATTGFTSLQLGGTTASFPALNRSGTNILFRLADNSDYTTISAKGLTTGLASSVASFQLVQTADVSVTAAATNLVTGNSGFSVVAGNDGGGNQFKDTIQWGTGVTNVTSGTAAGAPVARTYSVSAGSLRLAMASGTYTVSIATLK